MTASEIDLPFSPAQLARGLEAGMRDWRPGDRKPLMTPICDVAAAAIKHCLEQRDISVSLWATHQAANPPRTWTYCHVLAVAELPSGLFTVDGAHGQFLSKVLGRRIDIPLAQQVSEAQAGCVAFRSDTYREAILETMDAIFGTEANESLMERAQDVYGQWWNPANFEPYEPDVDTRWIVDRILPHMQDVLAVH